MSHFAHINASGIVDNVIVAELEFIYSKSIDDPERWVQTSYNTRGGVHYGDNGQPDGKPPLRKNYAGIGYTYDQQRDVFIPPKPFPSWVLNEQSCLWEPPTPRPQDGKRYRWDEATQSWIEIQIGAK